MRIFLFACLCFIAPLASAQGQADHAVIHFLGAEFQKDAKLEIMINGNSIGYLTKGLQIDHVQHTLGEITILTQGYNMIDAKYGPPVQLKMTVEAGQEYYLSGKYSPKVHLTVISAQEVDGVIKGGKKIISVIESMEQ